MPKLIHKRNPLRCLRIRMPEWIRSRRGFTLMEMSVVVVVASLLVGGIMAISNVREGSQRARVMKEGSEFVELFQNFKARYHYYPGDYPGDGSAAYTNISGNGDGIFNTTPPEGLYAWQQLKVTGMYSGNYQSAFNSSSGVSLPGVNVEGSGLTGGGWVPLEYFTSSATGKIFANVLRLGAPGNNLLLEQPIITAEQLQAIDIKADDGLPESGIIIGGSLAADACVTKNGTQAVYNPSGKCTGNFAIEAGISNCKTPPCSGTGGSSGSSGTSSSSGSSSGCTSSGVYADCTNNGDCGSFCCKFGACVDAINCTGPSSSSGGSASGSSSGASCNTDADCFKPTQCLVCTGGFCQPDPNKICGICACIDGTIVNTGIVNCNCNPSSGGTSIPCSTAYPVGIWCPAGYKNDIACPANCVGGSSSSSSSTGGGGCPNGSYSDISTCQADCVGDTPVCTQAYNGCWLCHHTTGESRCPNGPGFMTEALCMALGNPLPVQGGPTCDAICIAKWGAGSHCQNVGCWNDSNYANCWYAYTVFDGCQ